MKPPFLSSWQRAWLGSGARTPGNDVHAELLARYSEPHRAYHTVQHLGECLEQFAVGETLAEHAAEVELALWFHDAIYDVRASDNEARSASWAKSALVTAGGSQESANLVHTLIMATRHTSVPAGIDEQVVVDIDLSILGAGPQRFAEYEAQIRREYKHVPGIVFRHKRKAILRSFLERPFIYSTSHFREHLEGTARSNLKRAVGDNAT